VAKKWVPGNQFPGHTNCINNIQQVPANCRLLDDRGRPLRTSENSQAEVATLIEMFSAPGAMVYDGSCGTMVSANAALRTGRLYVGHDPCQTTLDIALHRTKQYFVDLRRSGLLPKIVDGVCQLAEAPTHQEQCLQNWAQRYLDSHGRVEGRADHLEGSSSQKELIEQDKVPPSNLPAIPPEVTEILSHCIPR
jgi:hypothetical protein